MSSRAETVSWQLVKVPVLAQPLWLAGESLYLYSCVCMCVYVCMSGSPFFPFSVDPAVFMSVVASVALLTCSIIFYVSMCMHKCGNNYLNFPKKKKDMIIDVNSTKSFNDTIDIGELESLLENSEVYNSAEQAAVYGLRDLGLKTVKEKVLYLHKCGHFTKQRMLFNVEIFKDYGVTRKAIEDHFPTRCTSCLKGNMQMDKRFLIPGEDDSTYVCPDA